MQRCPADAEMSGGFCHVPFVGSQDFNDATPLSRLIGFEQGCATGCLALALRVTIHSDRAFSGGQWRARLRIVEELIW